MPHLSVGNVRGKSRLRRDNSVVPRAAAAERTRVHSDRCLFDQSSYSNNAGGLGNLPVYRLGDGRRGLAQLAVGEYRDATMWLPAIAPSAAAESAAPIPVATSSQPASSALCFSMPVIWYAQV